MNNIRPVFLNLLLIRMPVAAVISIIHRMSGVVMVLTIPLVFYMLDLSLSGDEGFEQVRSMFFDGFDRLLLLCFVWGLVHHLLAGLRFLLIDLDIGVEHYASTRSAWMVVSGAIIFTLLLGLFS